jgi:predicted dehydrogenase
MSEAVRVGVIGTSGYTESMHLTNLKSHPGARLSAICGRNTARATELAQKYSIPAVYSDYHELIASGDLQALVVSSPDDLHYSMTMDALDGGLHVICEKPMAMTAEQARAMYARAEAAGVKHMTYFTWRWLPIARAVRRLIDDGYIGRCLQCNIRYAIGFAREPRFFWRLDPARANGILGDLGSHAIDLAQWYVGPITRVAAHLATLMEHPGPDGRPMAAANDSAVLAVTFENGAEGLVQATALAHIGERNQDVRIALHGDAGTLEIDLRFNGGEIRGVRAGGEQFEVLPVPKDIAGRVDLRNPLQVFVQQSVGDRLFIEAILEDRPVAPTFYDGMKAQMVIEAALQSHQTGCWTTVG